MPFLLHVTGSSDVVGGKGHMAKIEEIDARYSQAASRKDTGMSIAQAPPGTARRTRSFSVVVAGGAGASFVLIGLWGFFDPLRFFESLAVFEPFNRHFIRDIGAFQAGLGAVLLLAVFVRDSLLAALAGVATGASLHVVSHLVDRHEGGEPERDIPFFAAIAVLLIVAAVARAREMSRDA